MLSKVSATSIVLLLFGFSTASAEIVVTGRRGPRNPYSDNVYLVPYAPTGTANYADTSGLDSGGGGGGEIVVVGTPAQEKPAEEIVVVAEKEEHPVVARLKKDQIDALTCQLGIAEACKLLDAIVEECSQGSVFACTRAVNIEGLLDPESQKQVTEDLNDHNEGLKEDCRYRQEFCREL